ncbi:hypothetical protein OSTOST_17881 [Ostertagia ostertagi]
MAFLIGKMKEIKEVSLNIEDSDLTIFNALLDQLIQAEMLSWKFYTLNGARAGRQFRRQYFLGSRLVRRVVTAVVQISMIAANASTLRVVGRIGLSEAGALNSSMHLERLSLMMFDLGFDASQTAICSHFLEIARSGATFRHLSYTSFVGFDPTDDVVQTFLDRCQVRSLRLTMMRGPYIPPQPDYMVGKVRQIDHIELGEVVDKPNIFNSLVTYENVFKKVFPNVQDIPLFPALVNGSPRGTIHHLYIYCQYVVLVLNYSLI